MQPASDIFLGWVTGRTGQSLYVRQLRDAKIKPLVETFDAEMLNLYGMKSEVWHAWIARVAHPSF